MIKNFEEYINEDYFSKLASRKDTGTARKENYLNEDIVKEYIEKGFEDSIKSISIRKEIGETFVDIDGTFHMRKDVDRIPFQFGKVTGDFDCSECENLTSLEGCPREVGGDFKCVGCKKLESLEGCPKRVGKLFTCAHCNNLTSLEGGPEKVDGNFMCLYCGNVTSLKGCPKEVGNIFAFMNCEKLTSLEGCPEKVGGNFSCWKCGKQFTIEEVQSLCKVKGKIIV